MSLKVIVIGAGVIGLSCAWRLAAAGARVELLESRDCGQGATLGALGALWPAGPLVNGPLQQLHRQSLWQFEAFAAELSAASAAWNSSIPKNPPSAPPPRPRPPAPTGPPSPAPCP